MIQEAKQTYRGVLCVHCRLPIPVPAKVARQESKAANDESSKGEDLGPRVFTLRCRVCEGEGMYAEAKFLDVEGTPRARIAPNKKGPQPLKQSEKFTRAANG